MSPVRKGYPGPARNARQSTWDSAKGMFFPADVQTHIAHILGPLPADLHAGAGHGIAQRRPEAHLTMTRVM